MPLSLTVFLSAALIISVFIFKKMITNDAQNDYKLRDILANTKEEEPEVQEELQHSFKFSKELTKEKETYTPPKQEEAEKVYAHNMYEEIGAKQETIQKPSFYSTNTHETKTYQQPLKPTYSQDTYYEKINDDACPEYTSKEEDYSTTQYNKTYEDKYEETTDEVEEDTKETYIQTPTKPSRNLYDYVKTFWRGITFTVGMLICVYSFLGLTQGSPDSALLYTLWLLIGVMLIK